MKVVVVNSGSSSIKYEVFEAARCTSVAAGLLERIGTADSRLRHRWIDPSGSPAEIVETYPVADHRQAFERILAATDRERGLPDVAELLAFGHRVVHGGERFRAPTMVDASVLQALRALDSLAPLHNPANVMGIEILRDLYPGVPQVAVFDTAFHHTMPPHAFHYALPQEMYRDHHVRRYGFHGTSHQYVVREAAEFLGITLTRFNAISLHLGNGASAAAIEGGKSIDTSMGFTPLEGLVMGTRCGDLDPALPFYLLRSTGQAAEEIERQLNQDSGLRGICGAGDMREVERRAAQGDAPAQLALEMFCYRIKKYIGAYLAVLGRADAILFTAGIGEHSALVRGRVCAGLTAFGIRLDERKNAGVGRVISEIQHADGAVKILVVPTDEEREIARQTLQAVCTARTPRSQP